MYILETGNVIKFLLISLYHITATEEIYSLSGRNDTVSMNY